MVAELHRGPLPDGETLEHYTRLIPNAGERIMLLVERDAAHQQSMELAPDCNPSVGASVFLKVYSNRSEATITRKS